MHPKLLFTYLSRGVSSRLIQAAHSDDPHPCIVKFGALVDNGAEGVTKDAARPVGPYERAIEKDHVDA